VHSICVFLGVSSEVTKPCLSQKLLPLLPLGYAGVIENNSIKPTKCHKQQRGHNFCLIPPPLSFLIVGPYKSEQTLTYSPNMLTDSVSPACSLRRSIRPV